MPSLGEAPSGGAGALWLLWGFSKVTRCKSETVSGHTRSNGYVYHRGKNETQQRICIPNLPNDLYITP